MIVEDETQIDPMVLLLAVIVEEGGSLTVPLTAFQDLGMTGDIALAIDPSPDGLSVTLKIVEEPTDA